MNQNPWDYTPIGIEPVRGPNPWLWLVSVIVVVGLLAASFFLPIPIFFGYLPGPVRDVEKLVEVTDARTYSSEGNLYLTTVSVDTQVTVFDMVQSLIDPEKMIVMQQDVTQGQTLRQLQREQERQIIESKRRAQEVALTALGFAKPHGDGARVAATVKGAPADGKLKPGDLILSIDGQRIETTCDVGRAVAAHEIGEPVTIVVRRKGEKVNLRVNTTSDPRDPTAPLIGIHMEEVNYSFDPGLNVTFKTGEIAGPSAGLMFSLALYDRLTPDDLTGGRAIAGTGTVECDGGVGAIGGVEQKVAGAENKGAEIFLSPQGNVSSARSVADEIQIVPISTFDDAVDYLEGLE